MAKLVEIVILPADESSRAQIGLAASGITALTPRRNTMELSSPESILALITAYGNPTRLQRRHGPLEAARSASKAARLHCKCGHCRQCLDNARWERIFAEKFADPDYYTRSVMHIASPLTSI
jgi:hypothetical protein